jgi:hypothetical protein
MTTDRRGFNEVNDSVPSDVKNAATQELESEPTSHDNNATYYGTAPVLSRSGINQIALIEDETESCDDASCESFDDSSCFSESNA